MKTALALIAVALVVMFGLQGAEYWQQHETQQAAQSVAVQFHKSSLNAAVQATKQAAEGKEIIAHVEAQLDDIIARGKADVDITSAVRTILCDSLMFDEQTADQKVKALAKAMVRQSCGGVAFPKT